MGLYKKKLALMADSCRHRTTLIPFTMSPQLLSALGIIVFSNGDLALAVFLTTPTYFDT